MELAAAISYYTMLSLAPLVLVTIALAGLFFGKDVVAAGVVAQVRGLVGEAGAAVVATVLETSEDPETSALSVLGGLIVLFAGATTVFVQLQDALNRIWCVEPNPERGALWEFVKGRLLSLAMVLGIGFLLLVSLCADAALAAFATWATASIAALPILLQAINTAVSLLVITGLFALIFKVLPDTDVAWRDVWFGALLTSLLFTLGKNVIGLYLGRAGIGSTYGAAGSLVVLTVWVYYASLIVLFGAQVTYIRSKRGAASGIPAPPRTSVLSS
jgi:membrane protein